MITTIKIPMIIDGDEEIAELDYCHDSGKILSIIIDGTDYGYTEHYYLLLKLLGGKEQILFRHLKNSTDAQIEAREERRHA